MNKILKRLSITSEPEKHVEEFIENESNLLVKQFQDLNITIYGTYEEPLFKAKDIGDLLDIKDIYSSIKDFDKDESDSIRLVDSLGRSQDIKMLTEQGLYKILMTSRKSIAKQFQKWVFTVIKEIRLTGEYKLKQQIELKEKELQENQTKLIEASKEHQQKEKEHKKELKQKEEEIKQQQVLLKIKELELQEMKAKTYEEVVKPGHVYIIECDGGIKIGKTGDEVLKRLKGLQTGNVNKIKIIFDCATCNEDLLEKTVHYILDRYRVNKKREFFECKVEYMKMIIEFVNNNINTMKSTFENISKEELYEKYTIKLEELKEKYKIEEFNENIEYDENTKELIKILKEKYCYKKEEFVFLKDIKILLKENNIQYNTKNLINIIKTEYSECKYYEFKCMDYKNYRNVIFNISLK